MTNKVILKADHVGSFLRPQAIKQARVAYADGKIGQAALKKVEDQEIEKLVKQQIDAGLRAITDGEFRRSWWHQDYFIGLDGFEKVTTERGYQFEEDETKPENYEITGKIKFNNHYFIEHFKFVKELVDKYGDGTQVAKMTIPAPFVIMYREVTAREKEVYPHIGDVFKDLAAAYQDAIKAFYDAGCRYLQLDDTILTTFADAEFVEHMRETSNGLSKDEIYDLVIKTTREALKDKPEDLIVATHLCRGNFRSTHIHADGDYEYVAKRFDELGFDAYFLEYDNERSGGFEPLRHIANKDTVVVLGLITSKTPELEDEDEVIRRIEEASKYLSKEQLALSPQCGFSSTEEGNKLTEEEQWYKIKHVVQIADRVWDKAPAQK